MECGIVWEKFGDKVHKTQSSMAQGEGVSVLLRAYKHTSDIKYYETAKKAIDFMLIDIEKGGTTKYLDNKEEIIFQEYVCSNYLGVLNGWIFSIFGLYDFVIIEKNMKKESYEYYKNILDKSIKTMEKYLRKYDRKFWSNYDLVGTITSPAYHDLHIMQLNVMYNLFKNEEFKKYSDKWDKNKKSFICKGLAVLIKIKQKIIRKSYYDINTSLVE